MAKAKKVKQKKGFFRRLLSTFFDVPRWINAEQYRDVNQTLYRKVQDSFRIAKATHHETFEEAMARLAITEEDLVERLRTNRRYLLIMLGLIVMLVFYAFFLLFHGAIAGTLMLLSVIMLSCVRAFQYSFWNFQIKQRRLGCRFQDWWKSGISNFF